MKLYISGPMRGHKDLNFPAFEKAARLLRAVGYEVVSPHEMDLSNGLDPSGEEPEGKELGRILLRDAEAVLECDGVAQLEGWEGSSGARWECDLAGMMEYECRLVEGWVRVPRIVGLTGPKGVGKTTFANDMPHHRFSFADPLRSMMDVFLGYFDMEVENFDGDKEKKIPNLGVSFRHAMQTLGTEWGRTRIHPDVWVEAMESRLSRFGKEQIVIDDVRFPNEAEMIHVAGGEIWRLTRKGFTPSGDQHASEAGLPDDLVDREVEL